MNSEVCEAGTYVLFVAAVLCWCYKKLLIFFACCFFYSLASLLLAISVCEDSENTAELD